MEDYMYLWRGVDKLSFTFDDKPNGVINKLIAIKDYVFVATSANYLYYGEVLLEDDKSPTLTLKTTQFDAVDIASNTNYLFIINSKGHVLKVNPYDLSVVETIILKEGPKCCSHGYKQENEIIKVKSIAVNDTSALFVTENGQLWASGSQPEIDINSTEPKKVKFFDGRTISQVTCGSNFNVAIVRKPNKNIRDDTNNKNELEEEEVFVNSCPQCLNNTMLSPASITSSDTCPLGLHVQQFNEDRSTSSISTLSTASKEHDIPLLEECDRKDHNVVTEEYKEKDSINISELDEEKKSVIFINTETAKQFFTRQISWVSSYGNVKEELVDNTGNSTKLIKQNVSNIANFVYEGMKNVGGKVVTLSRHMSGSSDINELKDDNNEQVEEQAAALSKPDTNNLALSLRCEEFPWSSSTGSLEHKLSQQELNERISVLSRTGSDILSTELWTWGDIRYGQLGTGDNIKRTRPILVAKLNKTGLRKIACGAFHVIALTLDGRVFVWGRNNFKQVTLNSTADQSAPQLFSTKLYSNERAKDIAAGPAHSLIMMHHGLYFIGQSSKAAEMFQLDVRSIEQSSTKQIFSSGQYSCCSFLNEPTIDINEDLVDNQIFLEQMITVYQNLIKPFKKKVGAAQESNVYETMCRCYTELLNFNVLNVVSLWDYSKHIKEAYEVVIIANIEEYFTVYKYYLNVICDIISFGGFIYIAKIIEIPQKVSNCFIDKMKGNGTKKVNNEIVITMALQHPLKNLDRYKNTIQSLMKSNGQQMGIERLHDALVKWEQLCDEQEKRQKEAETTRSFWESSGKIGELLRSPKRRLIKESRSHPITLFNSGRFSTHWFILLNDVFVHVSGAYHTMHPLKTLWVESLPDSESLQNAISIITPEESFVLYTSTSSDCKEWFYALQNAIKCNLPRVIGNTPPIVRSASFSFTKHSFFKDAKYIGCWLSGKPYGSGKLEWSDGRIYTGHFHKGVICGSGKMEIPTQGYFKDGLPHGHGVKKEGHFMASVASVYIGEWTAGVKQGYGVIDNIMTGEKYLGSWNNNMKHGSGLIVTLDGIYYEGVFNQDVLMGYGVMVFEDGTHYEGEFKSAGIFCGKGLLTFCNGNTLEGNINGPWNDDVKVVATLHMNKDNGNVSNNSKPLSFGKLCVAPDQKWKAIFNQCYQQLGVTEITAKASFNEKFVETQKAWQNVAAIIKSHQKTLQEKNISDNTSTNKDKNNENIDQLDNIPSFGKDELTIQSYKEIHEYLVQAFESPHHPLGILLTEIATVYTATYGGVRVHPLLLSHAVTELHSITLRIYDIVTLLFPALLRGGKEYVLESEDDDKSKRQLISASAILHPILLPRVHSALFVLYALHNKKEDDAYWERITKWNKQPNIILMTFLDIDQKFKNLEENSYQKQSYFSEAIEALQQLKTTFSPLEKLLVVANTFRQMTQAVKKHVDSTYSWSMDELLPVFCFVVVRARVLQLGSEIHFIKDFMEPHLKNGELEIMFATLEACYEQILKEKTNAVD
ncbi:hypothetical protein M0802_009252 [Mischocyttarus mexicanus]|nr:hypothetical protein M0802_009252 [Mischocyttarus mexicanus]